MPGTRKPLWLLAAGALVAAGACQRAQPVEEPALPRPATIRELMGSVIDPSGDVLFEAVATISDENGIREIAPRTDEEWQNVRRHAVVLIEAPNLLVMPGRAVAGPTEKSRVAGVELEPAQIQALIEADRTAFITHARSLQDAAMQALKAIDARNKDALFAASERIDTACENCHLRYWYPSAAPR